MNNKKIKNMYEIIVIIIFIIIIGIIIFLVLKGNIIFNKNFNKKTIKVNINKINNDNESVRTNHVSIKSSGNETNTFDKNSLNEQKKFIKLEEDTINNQNNNLLFSENNNNNNKDNNNNMKKIEKLNNLIKLNKTANQIEYLDSVEDYKNAKLENIIKNDMGKFLYGENEIDTHINENENKDNIVSTQIQQTC